MFGEELISFADNTFGGEETRGVRDAACILSLTPSRWWFFFLVGKNGRK